MDTIERQMMELLRRIDQMSERGGHFSRARDETSPVQHAVLLVLGELNREINDLAPLVGRFRHHREAFDKFREEFQILRVRVDAMQVGRMADGAVHRPGTPGSSRRGPPEPPSAGR